MNPHEPIYRTCPTCGATTIGMTAWRNRGPEGRDTLTQRGIAPRRGGLCSPCYTREAWRALAAATPPPIGTKVSREILLLEWKHFADPHLSLAENCRRIAPRIGMRWRTMEKALYRAGIAGRAA